MNNVKIKVDNNGDLRFCLKLSSLSVDAESICPFETPRAIGKGLFFKYVGYFRLRIGYGNSLINIHLRG